MKVSMIYMASGFGKRYGTNKLITEFRGEPLYLHGLLSLQKAAKLLEKTEKINCQLILISQYERVLSGSVEQVPEAERFFNEDSDQGITASIKLGTEVAWDNADAYLYFVADQPCMAGETIARFVSEFMKSKKGIGCVCAKGHRGKRYKARTRRDYKRYRPAGRSDCIAPGTGKYVIFQILKTSELF